MLFIGTMFETEDLFASVAFEGEEIELATVFDTTVFAKVGEFKSHRVLS